jgi:CRP-like cAMP-binding protein
MPIKNAKSPSIPSQDFLERLQRYPDLQAEFEALLQIVENSEGDVVKADEAEERVAQELQRLGQQALQTWAIRKHQKLQAESDSRCDLSRKEKKDSTGTPATAKSK